MAAEAVEYIQVFNTQLLYIPHLTNKFNQVPI